MDMSINYLCEHLSNAVENEDVTELIRLLRCMTKQVRLLKTDEELHTYDQMFKNWLRDIDNEEYTKAYNDFYCAVEDEVDRAVKLGIGLYGGHPRTLGHCYMLR